MQLRAHSWFVLGSMVTAAATFAACGGGSNSSAPADAGDVADSTTTDGAGDDTAFVNHGQVVSITVTPTSASVDVTNGSSMPIVYQAIGTYEDGTSGPVAASWSLDRPDLGTIDASGSFAANGKLGGLAIVTANFNGKTATAHATVQLHIDQDLGTGIATADKAKFDAPDATPSGTLLYPYDKTVFPKGLLPPEIMWSGGAVGDLYRVRVKEKYVDATYYANADPPSRVTADVDTWNALTQSNAGETVTLEVTRLSAGQAHAPMTESWTIAKGSLRGSIYYWAVNTGQLMKIAPNASSPTVAFDGGTADQLGNPAPASYDGTVPPWEPASGNKRCVACHTVSKDGSTIAAVFEKKGSTASPWGTIDLTKSPSSLAQITPYTSTTIYLGITPEGAYAVHNDVDMTMHLANAKTGAAIASALDAFADKTCDPAFSPDGKMLAFSSNVVGGYPVEFWNANLDVMDFDPTTTSFANRRQILSGGGQAIAFPSFAPDSKWIFYQKGDYSRAKYGTNQVGHDDLYMTDVAKSVGELSLATASGASLDAKNQHLAYQPTVNPVSVGGYTWVVFVSPRDYGNRMLSTSNPTYENRKQLWVAAIDANPQPGKDPSHPAFWLPGQDLTTTNMSGYWALEPCRGNGTSCDQGFECCTGFCRPDSTGALTCVPSTSSCSSVGEKCTADADCCENPNAKCVGGFCAYGGPM